MTIVRIDLKTTRTVFTQSDQLDGERFTFQYRWQERNQEWLMALTAPAGETLKGFRLTADEQIAAAITRDFLPPGKLLVADLDGQGDPRVDGLSAPGRVAVLYADTETVEAERTKNDAIFTTTVRLL